MKAERKYLVHYMDAAFDMTGAAPNYVRLGKDLEEFNVELNPNVETGVNILGEHWVHHNGYDTSSDVDPIYYEYDDAFTEKIMEIAMLRQAGDSCKTTCVEVLLKPGEGDAKPTVIRAVREDAYVVPNSYGGDTSGIQTPFTVYYAGNRVEGSFDLETKKFAPNV